MFIRGRVGVTKDGPVEERDITPDMDVIFIYPRMPIGVKQQVLGAAAKISITTQKRTARGKKRPNEPQKTELNIGAYQAALLEHNIIGWQGPSFLDPAGSPLPLTAANIRLLDSSDPTVQRVIQEIGERNVEPDEEEEDESDPNALPPGIVAIIDGD